MVEVIERPESEYAPTNTIYKYGIVVYKKYYLLYKILETRFYLNKIKSWDNKKSRYQVVSMGESGHEKKQKTITKTKIHRIFKIGHDW